jgi:hypothetical protein
VSSIFAGEQMRTPEGIGLGASEADVRAAYPELREAGRRWPLSVGLVTEGQATHRYGFGFEGGRLAVLMIGLDRQTCTG